MFRDYSNYEVYEDGRIWSYYKNKFLKPITMPNGYQVVNLYDNEGKQKKYYVHRVVFEAVSGEPIPENLEVNHRNEDKTDNRFFENLNLLTHKDNNNWGTRNERCRKQVGAYKDGNLVMSFPSIIEASRQGFNKCHISDCCNGNRKTHKGFQWKYI